jgi:hypothetical protein
MFGFSLVASPAKPFIPLVLFVVKPFLLPLLLILLVLLFKVILLTALLVDKLEKELRLLEGFNEAISFWFVGEV